MLILTRKISESVIIDEDIQCTILGVKGNHVRLGFDAPKHKTIHREEIQQKILKKIRNEELNQQSYVDNTYLIQHDGAFDKALPNKTSH